MSGDLASLRGMSTPSQRRGTQLAHVRGYVVHLLGIKRRTPDVSLSDQSKARRRLLRLRIRLGTCEQRLHHFCGCILHVRQHVRIDIEREGNACMPKLLAYNLR